MPADLSQGISEGYGTGVGIVACGPPYAGDVDWQYRGTQKLGTLQVDDQPVVGDYGIH